MDLLKYSMEKTIGASHSHCLDVNDAPDGSWYQNQKSLKNVSAQSLGIIAVRMAPEAIEIQDQVTYFAIDVFPDDVTPSWRVLRRYNDFILLALKLGVYHLPGAPFPRKHLTGCTGAKLERRRESLDNWITQAISLAKKGTAVSHLRGFLGNPPARSLSLKQEVSNYELPTDAKLPAFIVPSTMSFDKTEPSPEEEDGEEPLANSSKRHCASKDKPHSLSTFLLGEITRVYSDRHCVSFAV